MRDERSVARSRVEPIRVTLSDTLLVLRPKFLHPDSTDIQTISALLWRCFPGLRSDLSCRPCPLAKYRIFSHLCSGLWRTEPSPCLRKASGVSRCFRLIGPRMSPDSIFQCSTFARSSHTSDYSLMISASSNYPCIQLR